MTELSTVTIDPETLGGTPVFAGTRVPADTLLQYLVRGRTIDAFLEDYPTVRREQAVSMLQEMGAVS